MSDTIIKASDISKSYRLGQIGMTSLRDDIARLGQWTKSKLSASIQNTQENDKLFWALRGVSFDIQAGEIVGVIGRNGAGKSTLLKILSRITEPSSGEIEINGRIGSLLEVGTGFHPELSGRDNIYLNGAILGMTRQEVNSKFNEIVEFSEVGQFLDTPVKRYSSGMYVKLAFAVAAHLDPEILLIDEVLAVGDAAFQKKCLDRMQDISKNSGRTILFVSHSIVSIRRLCQKCMVLEKGTLKGILPVEEAVQLYLPKTQSSNYCINLEDKPRSWGTDGRLAKMLEVRKLNSSPIKFGEAFGIELVFRVFQEIKAGMVGLAINTIDGTRVMTLDSDADGRVINWSPGIWTVSMNIERMPVSPGRYYFCISLGGTTLYDFVDSFATWEIESSSKDFESDRGYGGCRLLPSTSWKCNKV